MADEPTTTVPSNTSTEPTGSGTAPSPTEKPENMVPYSRFQETNSALKEANTIIAKFKADEEKRQQEQAIKAGEHEKVIADLQPRAKRAEELEAIVGKSVEALMQEIPEEKRGLIPDLSVELKLDYINRNRAFLLSADKPKNVGTPSSPATGGEDVGNSTIFTLDQISDPAFYAKNRDAIMKASKEGRVKD